MNVEEFEDQSKKMWDTRRMGTSNFQVYEEHMKALWTFLARLYGVSLMKSFLMEFLRVEARGVRSWELLVCVIIERTWKSISKICWQANTFMKSFYTRSGPRCSQLLVVCLPPPIFPPNREQKIWKYLLPVVRSCHDTKTKHRKQTRLLRQKIKYWSWGVSSLSNVEHRAKHFINFFSSASLVLLCSIYEYVGG